jgi:hypothetical protein
VPSTPTLGIHAQVPSHTMELAPGRDSGWLRAYLAYSSEKNPRAGSVATASNIHPMALVGTREAISAPTAAITVKETARI